MQLVLMSSLNTQKSYVSCIHIQHQSFKQNRKKKQINVCSSLFLHLNLKKNLVEILQFYFYFFID